MSGVATAAFTTFVVLAVALGALCGRWRRAAESERADAILRTEIDHLED